MATKRWSEAKCRAARRDFLRRLDSASLFHRVFDALPGLHFFAKDRRGRLLFVSRGILEHNGLQHDWEVAGRSDFDLNPGPYAAKYVADDEIVYRSGRPLLNRVELWFDRVGLPDWYVTNKFPMFDEAGCIIGIMGTLESCAERRRGAKPFVDILPAVEMIRRRVADPPSMKELAELCAMSPRRLQRKFRAAYRLSPQAFLMKTRIRAACDALRTSTRSLSEIALDAGFRDQSSFTMHFRKHAGTTPRRYRLETRPARNDEAAKD